MRLQLKTPLLATAVGSIIGYVLLGGATIASAGVRHRSGSVHQQVAHDLAAAGHGSSVVMTGTDIMGAVVAVLAIVATLFMVTTFIRRRATLRATVPAVPTVPAASS